MARTKNTKKSTHDNQQSGAGPVESNSVRGGKPSCFTTSGEDLKDILVPEKCGFVDGSCSSAPHEKNNNRSALQDAIKKPCPSENKFSSEPLIVQKDFSNIIHPLLQLKQNFFHVNNKKFTIDFLKKKCFSKRVCLFHSIDSWKLLRLLKALEMYADGKIPFHTFCRELNDSYPRDSWIFCMRCKRSVCLLCASAIVEKIESDEKLPTTIKNSDVWIQCVKAFEKEVVPGGYCAVLKLDSQYSHCCRLGNCIRKKRNIVKRANRSRKKINRRYSTMNEHLQVNDSEVHTNDGLLHYAPYRVVFKPSLRFYETLCAAEQGSPGSPNHQRPVYHSVISNNVAQIYDRMGIFPEGRHLDVIKYQKYYYLPIDEFPVEVLDVRNGKKSSFLLIRKIVLKFSADYKAHPAKGSCPLDDLSYFRQCCLMMDGDWEDADICNGVFGSIVCGEACPQDAGQNEILLCCRIYDTEFSIPTLSDSNMDEFINVCFGHVDKAGFETQRVGGSAGASVATTDQLRYFSKFKASYPVVAGSVVHIPVVSGRWRSYYVSPYRGPRVDDALCVHPYSTPKPGGAFYWSSYIFSVCPKFFENMAKVRFIVTRLLDLMEKKNLGCISPVARMVQNRYIDQAMWTNKNQENIWETMSKQVVYSLVPYTVGCHKDVTRNGVSRELVECKACLRWPKYCLPPSHSGTALGRGGCGYGVFTLMIVDHPEK